MISECDRLVFSVLLLRPLPSGSSLCRVEIFTKWSPMTSPSVAPTVAAASGGHGRLLAGSQQQVGECDRYAALPPFFCDQVMC